MDEQAKTATCDDWTKIALHCKECGIQFFRKVKGQRYCDEHRHLGGSVVRALHSSDSAGTNEGNK